MDQFRRERGQSIELTLRPTEFNRRIAPIDISDLGEALAEGATTRAESSADRELKNPIAGNAGCCARAASGHAAAAPPSVAKNFRRPMWLAM
jgi:hypothetical protein